MLEKIAGKGVQILIGGLMVTVGLGLGWVIDHTRLKKKINELEEDCEAEAEAEAEEAAEVTEEVKEDKKADKKAKSKVVEMPEKEKGSDKE